MWPLWDLTRLLSQLWISPRETSIQFCLPSEQTHSKIIRQMAHRFPGLGQVQWSVSLTQSYLRDHPVTNSSPGTAYSELKPAPRQPNGVHLTNHWNMTGDEYILQCMTESFLHHHSFIHSFTRHSASPPPPGRDSLFCAPVAPGKPSVKFITDRWWPMQDSSSTKLSAPEGRWRSICSLPSLQPLPITRRCSSIDSTGIYWSPTMYQALLEVLWNLQWAKQYEAYILVGASILARAVRQ